MISTSSNKFGTKVKDVFHLYPIYDLEVFYWHRLGYKKKLTMLTFNISNKVRRVAKIKYDTILDPPKIYHLLLHSFVVNLVSEWFENRSSSLRSYWDIN
jgi:hypothetical protein